MRTVYKNPYLADSVDAMGAVVCDYLGIANNNMRFVVSDEELSVFGWSNG